MGGRVSDIYVAAFVSGTEVGSRVRQAIAQVLGKDVELDSQSIEGTFGNNITVLRARVHRKKEVERVLSRIVRADYFVRSLEKAHERLDDNGVYHLRLDKSSAYRGAPELWEGGESIELRLKVVTYPFSYDEALGTVLALGPVNGQR